MRGIISTGANFVKYFSHHLLKVLFSFVETMPTPKTCIETLSQPLTLPCGLVLPNRLVKCPMQETLAEMPYFDPPVEKFREL